MLGGVLAGEFLLIKTVRYHILQQFTRYGLWKPGHVSEAAKDHPLSECYIELSFRHLFVYSAIWIVIVHEILLYPIFHRCYPRITSSQKATIGMILQIISVTLLITFQVYSRQEFLRHSSDAQNVSLPCVFFDQKSTLSTNFDYRWIAIPDFCTSLSLLMIGIGFLEFLSAQVPFHMKGVMLGTGYGTIFIVGIMSAALMLPFKAKLSVWGGGGIISCGFWYLLIAFLVQISICFALMVLTRRYKRRKREDVLPNEHYYAERYYSND